MVTICDFSSACLNSLLDSRSSDLLSHHCSHFHCPPGSTQQSREAKRGVKQPGELCSQALQLYLVLWCLHVQRENKHECQKKKKDVPWMLVVIGHFYEALHCNQVIFFCLQALKGGRRVINSFRIIIVILLKFILSVNCRFTIVQLKCVDILFSI